MTYSDAPRPPLPGSFQRFRDTNGRANGSPGPSAGPEEDEAPWWSCRLVDGATWLDSGSTRVEAVWGDADTCLAPRRQPTLVVGTSGAGKTVLTQHVMLGALGVEGFGSLLGYPVERTEGRVLYLAADRPDQARLSMVRLVPEGAGREVLRRQLVVVPGPPPEDVAANPRLLLEMARYAGATLVVPDSLKDMAFKLTDDAVGAKVNSAFQLLIADDRDVIVPHHVRKVGRQDSEQGVSIDDLYGSAWIFNGTGSVLYLERGPADVELRQLKAPGLDRASLRYVLTAAGELVTGVGDPILGAVTAAGDAGISTSFVGCCVLRKDSVSEAEAEQVRRRLKALERLGLVVTKGAGRNARWVLA